jgi:hypothetical protein
MRRALILLLVLLLPLKAIGAAVVPITGSPHHQHHAAQSNGTGANEASPDHHPTARSACDGMAQDVDADSGVVHEHVCPHLAMVTLVPVFSLPEPDRRAPEIERRPVRRFSSIVLDILVPPPTLNA